MISSAKGAAPLLRCQSFRIFASLSMYARCLGALDWEAMLHQGAGNVMRHVNPAEAQLNKFETIVNLRTAKAFGIKIPQSLLIRADR